ncbi:MAG TPA: NEW3 domain-containing protein, partial [Roseiflexaceae bacterium]|nr:NEW3 domain-containing protein [Roseiflexaceae bacterium]
MAHSYRRLCILALLALLAALAPPARLALAATFTVTTTADTDDGLCNAANCTLREAIAAANASPGPDTILFNIPITDPGYVSAGGASYWRIMPATQLPALSGGETTIQGPAATDAPATAWPHPRIVLDGTAIGGSGGRGLVITSANNTIRRLTIVNFLQTVFVFTDDAGVGVLIDGAGATGNRVEGCYIGVAPDGTSGAGNASYGVRISGGASNNTIGGPLAAQRNVIAANGAGDFGRANVYVVGKNNAAPTPDVPGVGNVIQGNFIGTRADGTAQVGGGNGRHGVWVDELANGTQILGNLIAGHNHLTRTVYGVNLSGGGVGTYPQNTTIRGNIFGLRADGQPSGVSPLYNYIGLRIERATNTVIGGPTPADRNIISGSGDTPSGVLCDATSVAGVLITSSGATSTLLEGNYIGLDVDGDPLGGSGTSAMGNLGYGVLITSNSTGATVRGNVISNNQCDGVRVSSNGNTVERNLVGTDIAGNASGPALANGNAGVRIERGSGNRVLTNTVAIGPGALSGVLLKPTSSTDVTNTTIQGNLIGLRADGTPLAPVIDNSAALLLDRAPSPALGNVSGTTIAGNRIGGAEHGVQIEDNAAGGNVLRANTIGPSSGPSGAPGITTGFGVWLLRAGGNTIGGNSAADGNTIFGSGAHGIFLDGADSGNTTIANNTVRDNVGDGVRVRAATGVLIDRTATRANGGSGILLAEGGNADMPAPTFPPSPFTASPTPRLTVNVDATRCAGGCTVQVFTSPTSEPGEGPRYLAQATVSGGSAAVDVPGCDRYLTATVRDNATGNTSPFSTAVVDTVTGCAAASITLSEEVRISPPGSGPVPPGTAVVYEYTVTNTGGLPATVTISRTPGAGWAGAPVPNTLTVSAGAPQTFRITVNVPADAPGGASDTIQVTATGGTSPQTVSTTTQVAQVFGVDIEPEPPQTRNFTPGVTSAITFTHVVTNTGNGPDTFSLTTVTTPTLASVTVTPLTSCANVAAGASCRVQVNVPLPASPAPAYDIAVTAASAGGPSARDTALNRAVGVAAIPGLDPLDQTRTGLPGETVTFTRTVTNVGTATGAFTPTLAVVAPPPGWSAVLTPTASFTLAVDEGEVITHTATIPPLPTAPLSGTLVVARVTVTSEDGIAVTGEDRVLVGLRPSFSFGPALTPLDAAPGEEVSFSHTLTNTANGPDSFTVLVTPTADLEILSVTPADPIALGVGESVEVEVRARVRDFSAPGAQSIQLSAQTRSSPKPAPAAHTDVVNVLAVAGISLSPAQVKPALTLPATVTFTHVLTNVGNVAGTFLVTPTLVGPAPGWNLGAVTEDPAGCLTNLASGATCRFTVAVSVPDEPLPASRGYGVRIDVASGAASASVTDTVSVGPVARLAFAPDRAGSTAPDTPIEYTHTLTNTGNVTATFTLSATLVPAGWPAPQIIPAALPDVAPGVTETVRVRVTPPPNTPAGGPFDVRVTAQSSVAPNPTASVTDTTTVIPAPGAQLTPASQTLPVFPTPTQGDTATFGLRLANSGNTAISYTLGLAPLAPGAPWTALITPTETAVLPADVSVTQPVTVTVSVPAGASGAQAFRVEARHGATDELLATATVTATAATPLGDLLTPAENRRTALPGTTVVYTHTLTNIRPVSDTFTLSYISPFGWPTSVAPGSVFLPAGGTSTVIVTILVPTGV